MQAGNETLAYTPICPSVHPVHTRPGSTSGGQVQKGEGDNLQWNGRCMVIIENVTRGDGKAACSRREVVTLSAVSSSSM